MSEQTKIQWCDSTINFWSGCTKVSPGCAHCYAEALSARNLGNVGKWGKGAARKLHEAAFTNAILLNKRPWVCECGHWANTHPPEGRLACVKCGGELHRRRIFSLSLGDWLDPEVPIEWLARMLDTIRLCDQVTWILCTKRPELFEKRLAEVLWYERNRTGERESMDGPKFAFGDWVSEWLGGIPPKNVWLLTSVENQAMADERIPELLKIPAVVRGLSLEPLLGQVDLNTSEKSGPMAPVDWLIVGGESGCGARTCNVSWLRSIISQGKEAGVPVFVKQIGANWLCDIHDDARDFKQSPKHSKGGDPAEWPEYLRVREFPSPN
jgi:protein gp37